MTGPLLEKWVEDRAKQRLVIEPSYLDSEYPAHGVASACASGWRSVTLGSGSLLLSIPSSRWFKPRMLWITNMNTAVQEIWLYLTDSAAAASATIGGFIVEPRTTNLFAMDCITLGGGDIYESCLVGSTVVRIAGILVSSGPE